MSELPLDSWILVYCVCLAHSALLILREIPYADSGENIRGDREVRGRGEIKGGETFLEKLRRIEGKGKVLKVAVCFIKCKRHRNVTVLVTLMSR